MFHFLALKWRTKAQKLFGFSFLSYWSTSWNAALISLLNFHIFALNLIIEFLSVFNLAKEFFTCTYIHVHTCNTSLLHFRIQIFGRRNYTLISWGPSLYFSIKLFYCHITTNLNEHTVKHQCYNRQILSHLWGHKICCVTWGH